MSSVQCPVVQMRWSPANYVCMPTRKGGNWLHWVANLRHFFCVDPFGRLMCGKKYLDKIYKIIPIVEVYDYFFVNIL